MTADFLLTASSAGYIGQTYYFSSRFLF